MLINDIDIGVYADSFSVDNLHSVLQFLEVFNWDKDAEEWLREHLRIQSPSGEVGNYKPFLVETVVGIHDCGGTITFHHIPNCEVASTGRVYYEECDKCTYYMERFDRERIRR